MKRVACIIPFLFAAFSVNAQQIPTGELRIRDPFIYLDEPSGKYYMPARNVRDGGFVIYSSDDLLQWTLLGQCFTPEAGFWGKSDFWAPDMYRYKGRYYIFGTFSGADGMRGTGILAASYPEGPYTPLVNGPATPGEWMALDGALWFDKQNRPWMLYCHEWLQVGDGEIVAQRLSRDLKKPKGEPLVLFRASEAPWTAGFGEAGRNYVTDAPFIWTTPGGRLVMLWSSGGVNGKYCIGASYSDNGLAGPWRHCDAALNDGDGGHAMLFRDKRGELKISYHSPNKRTETLTIKNVRFAGDELEIAE